MQFSKTAVTDVMSGPVISLDELTSVRTALALAAQRGVHHFPVYGAGRLTGFVCTCDLRDAPLDSAVSERMRTAVISVDSPSTAEQAAREMSRNSVGSVLVMDGAEVCGIVTREDLVRNCDDAQHYLAEFHCVACGSRHHLRPGPDGAHLCVECCERSRGEDWLMFGTAD